MFFFLYLCRAEVVQDFGNYKDGPSIPHPSVPPSAPHNDIVVDCPANSNFDIHGIVNGVRHQTSFSGYSTRIRVDHGDISHSAMECLPLLHSEVVFFTNHIYVSNNSVILTFKVHNTGHVQRSVDLEVDVDLYFDDLDAAPIVELPGRQGFIVYSSKLAMTVLTHGSPLVDNVSTYWFGSYNELAYNYWSQTLETVCWDIDSGFAFSWQGMQVPPGGTVTKSTVIQFGLPFENLLEFAIRSGFPESILITDSIEITGAVFSANTRLGVRIVLIVDSDPSTLHQIGERLPAHGEFDFTISAAEILSQPGYHLFSFYAVDDIGCISNPHSFYTSVIFPSHTQSRSIAPSRTRSHTQSPHPTASLGPAPTVPAGHPHRMVPDCNPIGTNFDLRAFTDDNTEIRTTFNGFLTSVRRGTTEQYIINCHPVDFLGINVATHVMNLCPNTVLIIFIFRNQNLVTASIDLQVDADILFDDRDDASVVQIEANDRRGFIVYSEQNLMTFVCRGYPLVTNVSTYWFGAHSQREMNKWRQIQDFSLHGIDSTLAWSWQGISIPANGHVTRSIIVKMGPPLLKGIWLTITAGSVPTEIHYQDRVHVEGVIACDDQNAVCSLLLTSEQDPATVHEIATGLDGNGPFGIDISPALLEVVGRHTFSMYAIDQYGALSTPYIFTMNVIAPSKSPSRSPPRSRTQSPSASRERSASPLPAPTYPLNRVIPIRVQCASVHNFDFTGIDGANVISTTFMSEGWVTRLRIGHNDTASAVNCRPLQFSGVTLYTNVTNITSNTAVIVFRVVNGNAGDTIVSIEGESDIYFDGNDYAPVRQIPQRRGFIIYSSRHVFTFAGRGHPLVTDVSTYWFGDHHGRADNYWTQIVDDAYFVGDSAFAFTWQNVTIPAHGSVIKSLFVKFGFPDVNQLTLTSDFSGVHSPFNYLDTATLVMSVESVDTFETVSILMEVDHNPNYLYRVVHDVEATASIHFGFHPANYGLDPGHHVFTFYAIDSSGTISDGISLETTITAPTKSPSRSPAKSATHSRTPLASATQSRTPHPHPTMLAAAPHIPIIWSCSTGSFDLTGNYENHTIKTSFSGYYIRVRHGNVISESISNCQPLKWLGYDIHSNLTLLAPNTVHVSVRVVNLNATASSCDIVIFSDILLDGMDDAPVLGLPGNRGFVTWSHRFALTFLCGNNGLVNNVSTYWYGYHPLAFDNYFTQVHDDYWAGDDSAVTLSWQNVALPAHGSATRSMIIMFGLPDRNQITLRLNRTLLPSQLDAGSSIVISATISSYLSEEFISIVLTVDHDPFLMFEVQTGLHVSQEFVWSFRPRNFDINPGRRDITFYAIDSGGTVSNGETFTINVIAPTRTPSRSPSATVSISRSRTPSASESRRPAPTLPPGNAVPVTIVCGKNYNFDIEGFIDGHELIATYGGWATEVRLFHDGPALAVAHCQPLFAEGFILYTNLTKLSSNCVLLEFRFVSEVAVSHSVLLDVHADIHFNEDDAAAVRKIDDDRGFMVYDHAHIMSVLVRNTALVNNVTTFWFGLYSEMSASVYSQVNASAFWGSDSAFAFSWQNVVIPAHGKVSRSAIVKFGHPDLNHLTITAGTSGIPSQVQPGESHVISVTVNSNMETQCRLFVVIDSDVSQLYDVESNIHCPHGVTAFSYAFIPRNFDINPGSHFFGLVLVDSVGTISNSVTFYTTIVGPTQTRHRTLLPTLTLSPRPTQTQTSRPPPAPTYPAAPLLPIDVVCSEYYNFDVHGTDRDFHVGVTWQDAGFLTRLRIGHVLSESAFHCQPVTLWNVTLYTNVTKISSNAVYVNFRAYNHNATNLTVDWEVNADVQFDNDDFAPIRRDQQSRGFIIYSDRHAFTFFGRHSPLVDDVSTYWFGEHWGAMDHLWSQVQDEYFVGYDSAIAFSWQNVTLRPGQSVSKSVIMKFSLPDLNDLILGISADFPHELHVDSTVEIAALVESTLHEEHVNIVLVIDDVTSMVYLMMTELPVNVPFRLHFTPSRFHLEPGHHKFALFAIDTMGTVSATSSFTLSIVSDLPTRSAIRTASRSVSRSQSHLPAQTPGASHSRTRTYGPRSRTRSAQRSRTPTARASRTASERRSTPPRTRYSIPLPTKSKEPSDPTYPPISPGQKSGVAAHIGSGGIAGIAIAALVLVGILVVIIVCWRRTKRPGSLSSEIKTTGESVDDGVN